MTPGERFRQDWQGKKVLIMGLGLLGRGVGDAQVFAEAGAQVTVTDLKTGSELEPSLDRLRAFKIRYVLGRHERQDFETHDVVLRNPAVPRDSEFLDLSRKAGVPIKMDSSLFAGYCHLPIIGVTGTRGKTTTTLMVDEILKKGWTFKGPTFVGGNVPGRATLELLKEISARRRGCSMLKGSRSKMISQGVVVLELSSWELQGWDEEKISPHIGVFTNFYPDHLDRYRSMAQYFSDKLVIGKYQVEGDWLVVNAVLKDQKSKLKTGGKIQWFSAKDLPADVELMIPGEHNRANAAAAAKVAGIMGVEESEAFGVLADFKGVDFRLEPVATIAGVEYVNDTTSTTPVATIAALRSFRKPIILLVGGSSKNLDMRPLADEIVKLENKKGGIRGLILLKGKGTEELVREVEECRKKFPRIKESGKEKIYADLEEAVKAARELAKPGEMVLFSPGCASFSLFANEFERGEKFRQAVFK